MTKEFKLLVSKVDLLKPETINIDSNISKNKEIYFLPYSFYEKLNIHLIISPKDNNFNFIDKYLKISKIILTRLEIRTPRECFLHVCKDYCKYLDIMDNAIYRLSFSREDKIAFGYRITKTTDWCFVTLSNINNNEIGDNTIKLVNLLPANNPCNNDIYLRTLTGSTLDISQAIQAEIEHSIEEFGELNINSFCSRINNDFHFQNHRMIKKGKKVDRVFSSLSSMSSVSRGYVTYEGKSFYEIDLSNAQCLLLRILAGKRNVELDDYYNELTSSGKFYDVIMARAKELGYDVESVYDKETKIRDYYSFLNKRETKVLCYRSIFFKTKDTIISKTALLFKELFPKTYSFLEELNETESTAYVLQNIEASVILSLFEDSNYNVDFEYYTVHDAIYINDKSKIEEIKSLITERISKLSNGTINSVMFGEQKVAKQYVLSENHNEIETLVVNGRFEKHKKHSINEKFLVRINKFLELYNNNVSRKDILKELSISLHTYKEYKSKYINHPA